MRPVGELETVLCRLVEAYLEKNQAARVVAEGLREVGVGIFPVLDHITIRTHSIDRRAEAFEKLGYVCTDTLHYDDWYAKVYRASGAPALFLDQAYEDERGRTSLIPGWVERFGDEVLHHIAVRVEDIEDSVRVLAAKGVRFAGAIVGEPGSDLRQIFTVPELVDGEPFSVLELTERHRGFQGFSPPQADSLMRSTRVGA